MKRRGQIISADFIMAAVVFVVLFAALMLSWDSMINFSVKDSRMLSMERLATNAADMLASTSGYPSRWEDSPLQASAIGLASSGRILDPRKVSAFLGMDYAEAKQMLKTEGYDFFFRLVGSGETAGRLPSGNAAAFARRIVDYNGMSDTLEFYIWRQV